MTEKVILILVDGMRPDSLILCSNPFVDEFIAQSKCIMDATTVMPSVTLPCHISLFHSVSPERHGILSNTYVPQVRPVEGLVEVLNNYQKRCAMFYNWEELRNLSKPGALYESHFAGKSTFSYTDEQVTLSALTSLQKNKWDFSFIYLGNTDETGHKYGWMGTEYLAGVSNAWECIKKIYDTFSSEYTIIVTADHGGHDRMHGSDLAEDITIPIIINTNQDIVLKKQGNIIDIAPTIAAFMNIPTSLDWEGEALF